MATATKTGKATDQYCTLYIYVISCSWIDVLYLLVRYACLNTKRPRDISAYSRNRTLNILLGLIVGFQPLWLVISSKDARPTDTHSAHLQKKQTFCVVSFLSEQTKTTKKYFCQSAVFVWKRRLEWKTWLLTMKKVKWHTIINMYSNMNIFYLISHVVSHNHPTDLLSQQTFWLVTAGEAPS